MARLKQQYQEEILPQLQKELKVSSPMAVPRLEKITLNMGLGASARDKKIIQNALNDLERITSQKPVVTRARKSVAGFAIRDGWPVGCRVTLRRTLMYEFLDRLINIVIPRMRDFRGLPLRSFDGRGNYSMGIPEQIVFPEIDYDNIDQMRGLDVTITTNARDDAHAEALLRAFKFPLRS